MKKSEILQRVGSAVGMSLDLQNVTLRDSCMGVLIIDVVQGFCLAGSGPLSPPENDKIIDTMVACSSNIARAARYMDRPVMVFRDVHSAEQREGNYSVHCVAGTSETELMPDLRWMESDNGILICDKACTNGFIGAQKDNGKNTLVQWINDNVIQSLIVCGICADICVMETVQSILSAKTRGMFAELRDVIIPIDAVATYDYPGVHARDYAEFFGLYFMQQSGVIIAESVLM